MSCFDVFFICLRWFINILHSYICFCMRGEYVSCVWSYFVLYYDWYLCKLFLFKLDSQVSKIIFIISILDIIIYSYTHPFSLLLIRYLLLIIFTVINLVLLYIDCDLFTHILCENIVQVHYVCVWCMYVWNNVFRLRVLEYSKKKLNCVCVFAVFFAVF